MEITEELKKNEYNLVPSDGFTPPFPV